MARDRVIMFDSSQVLANFQRIVDPKYSRDFLHINSEGYVALDKAISGILVRSRIMRSIWKTYLVEAKPLKVKVEC